MRRMGRLAKSVARRLLLAAPLLSALLGAGPADPDKPAVPVGNMLEATGLPRRPDFFPIGVWLQEPHHIAEFKAIGINTFVGLSGNTDTATLQKFEANGVGLIATQSAVAVASPEQAAIVGWIVPDEPDNAQPKAGGGYDPCISPALLVAAYKDMKRNDPSRPVVLNFGRGISDVEWRGRGACAGQTETYYPLAVGGGDIISFDIYPVANYGGRLERVPNGLDNLRTWILKSGRAKVIWNAIEAVPVTSGAVPTARQERAEVWLSIIHGSRGIVYFVHQFSRDGAHLVRADGIFNFPELARTVAANNAELTRLAPVLNGPTIADGAAVSIRSRTPISAMIKRHDGATYLFAAARLDKAGRASFALRDPANGVAEVIGENRSLPVTNGIIKDRFEGYGVHIYRITGR